MKRPWTDDEVATLAGMKRAGLTNATIAKRLGRSICSVAQKVHQIGAKRRLDGKGGSLSNGNGYLLKGTPEI
jgi:hypothetical protein